MSPQQAVRRAQHIAGFDEGRYIGTHLQFKTNTWQRQAVIDRFGEKCRACGLGKWYNGKSLTLEVNHIDGDATNNVFSNLEFLCPICHSQTDNYRAKNKISTRKYRKKYRPSSSVVEQLPFREG